MKVAPEPALLLLSGIPPNSSWPGRLVGAIPSTEPSTIATFPADRSRQGHTWRGLPIDLAGVKFEVQACRLIDLGRTLASGRMLRRKSSLGGIFGLWPWGARVKSPRIPTFGGCL